MKKMAAVCSLVATQSVHW